MSVKVIEGFKGEPPTQDTFFAIFTGKTTLTGDIQIVEDQQSELSYVVCMSNFDLESLKQMPQSVADTGDIFFCFENAEFARQQLEGVSRATVVIDNYTIPSLPIDGRSSAEYVSVAK